MKKKLLLSATGLLVLVLCACHKDYSTEGTQHAVIDTLPANYPFASGFCAGVNLGIAIADTVNYTTDTTTLLPDSVQLDMPVAGNQGSQGSCTAWAVVYGVGSYYAHLKTGKPYSDTGNLSPKFTYNQITKGNCTCTSFLDNLYLLKTQGACSLNTMPYNEAECAKQPDSVQKTKAGPYAIAGWQKLDLHNLTLLKHALLDKKPVIFAIDVDNSFRVLSAPYIWNARTGSTGQLHAMVITGYDDHKKAFKIMNSWSTAWADKGFAWIDYDFFSKYVSANGYIVM